MVTTALDLARSSWYILLQLVYTRCVVHSVEKEEEEEEEEESGLCFLNLNIYSLAPQAPSPPDSTGNKFFLTS